MKRTRSNRPGSSHDLPPLPEMLYNAVVRDYRSAAILGRVYVSDLKQVPDEYLVEYQGGYISKETDLETLFCSRDEPIHLVRLPMENCEQILLVWIKKDDGKLIAIEAKEDMRVEDLHRKIAAVEGIPANDQRLSLLIQGDRLIKGRTMKDYGFIPGVVNIIEMDFGQTGGGTGFLAIDLKGVQTVGKGVPTKNKWEMYDIGMNLYGTCNNRSCVSKKTKSKEVVVNMKYGRVSLTSLTKFECPACQNEVAAKRLNLRRKQRTENKEVAVKVDVEVVEMEAGASRMKVSASSSVTKEANADIVGTFTAQNFLLTFGKSLFRYKNSE